MINSPSGERLFFRIEGFAHADIQPKKQNIPQLLAAMQALLAQRAAVPLPAQALVYSRSVLPVA